MIRYSYLVLIALVLSLTSCDELGSLVPDIDKVITETYTISIEEGMLTSASDTVFIDITQYDEYKDYEEYVDGYSLNKVTYRVLEYNAPEDLFFYGSIVAFDTAQTTSVTVGEITSVNLFDVSTIDSASVMQTDTVASDQLISWLESPGNFNLSFETSLEDSLGSEYVFAPEDFGGSLKLELNFHLTIITGAGSGGGLSF